jgi:anti-sigma factor RsiW
MSTKPIDLPCQRVVELVNDYLGHALTVRDREAFDAHLETCPPCTTYLEQMKTVLNLARSLGRAPTQEDVEPQLLALFKSWRGKTTS